jgi:GTPase SAR1 family protein
MLQSKIIFYIFIFLYIYKKNFFFLFLRNDTYQHVQNWLTDAKSLANENCVVCLIGNKCDLKDDRIIKFNDVAKFCQDNNLLYFDCSALTGENINEAFNKISKTILQKIEDGKLKIEEKSYLDNFKISNDEENEEKNKNSSYCNC